VNLLSARLAIRTAADRPAREELQALASLRECLAMPGHERLNRHRCLAGDTLDYIVGSCKQAVTTILCDLSQMLHEERRIVMPFFQLTTELFDGDRSIGDAGSERLAHRSRDAVIIHLDGPKELVSLPGVRPWIGENMPDESSLIFRGDRSMARRFEGDRNALVLFDVLGCSGIDQPFRKERWPQMCGWNTGPVKDMRCNRLGRGLIDVLS